MNRPWTGKSGLRLRRERKSYSSTRNFALGPEKPIQWAEAVKLVGGEADHTYILSVNVKN
jgi:hypothetical protein